ncbi:MAG: recombinase family protein [Dehalococcoidia bacterium]|nr:recombinase family protein [Dehalococcoidia bacterium]
MRALGYFQFDPEAPPGLPASRASQQRQLSQFCQREGHTLSDTFPESSSNAQGGRPALGRLLQHLREQRGTFLVLVTNPSHLGSTPEEALETVLAIDALGFRVASTMQGQPDAFQAVARTLQATGPGAERRQRILDAMQSKAIRGEGLGKPPYGYRIGNGKKLEEVTQEAEVVRLIYRLYLEQDLGLRNIARHLNQEGLHTRRGGNWSLVTIRDILRNRSYTGTYQRFGLRVPRNHPPLVTPEAFRRVHDLMQARTPNRHKGLVQPFLLSGLAYCAQCGNRMAGVTRRQSWRRKDGQRVQGVYRYYQCHSRINQSVCTYHTWRAPLLEEAVLNQLRQQLQVTATLPPRQQEAPDSATSADNQRSQIRQRRLYLKYLRQAADGAIPLRRLRSLLSELGPSSPGQEQGMGHGLAPSGPDEAADGSAILDTARWEKLGPEIQQQLLQLWVQRIVVGDGEAKVVVRQGITG